MKGSIKLKGECMNIRNRILALGSLLALTVATALPYSVVVINNSPWAADVKVIVASGSNKAFSVEPGGQGESGSTVANCISKVIIQLKGSGQSQKVVKPSTSNLSCHDWELEITPGGSVNVI